MATSTGSDLVKDYSCGACEEQHFEESADFFCKQCVKLFCGKCIHHHNQLYGKHSPMGRGEMSKWPLPKKTENFLLKCEDHRDKTLKIFCQDHSQLCCTTCAFLSHRLCKEVTLISDAVKNHSTDLRQLSEKIRAILKELKNVQNKQEASIESLEGSFSERLQDVKDLRQKFNAELDRIEKITLKELDDVRTALKESLKEDVTKCHKLGDELKQLSDAVLDLADQSKTELAFIASKKCSNKIQESKKYLNENCAKVETSITFQPHTDIEQFLSKQLSLEKIEQTTQSLAVLLDPHHVFVVKKNTKYNLRIPSDSKCDSYITGICTVCSDKIVVADHHFKRVKLLDQQFNVVSHCDVPVSDGDICQISTSEVAVTVAEGGIHGVQFISVNSGQLVKGRILQLQHGCACIAHHDGNLFVASKTALFHYTLTGTHVKKIYEDTTNDGAVRKCAVSPTGDRLYVTSSDKNMLLTLTRDGTVLYSFTDPELKCPMGVHVTAAGHVLVCGEESCTVIQVDSDGREEVVYSGDTNKFRETPSLSLLLQPY